MFALKPIHLEKKVSNENQIILLFDMDTTCPCLYPMLYTMEFLRFQSVSTQHADLIALKFWYDFWFEKFATSFCESFYSTSYNFEIIQSEIDNFIIYLENNKKIESNLIRLRNAEHANYTTIGHRLRSFLKFYSFLIDEYLTIQSQPQLSNIPITMPENLAQILIWTSELAQYHHALFIQSSQKLELISENDKNKKQELNDLIKLYRKTAFVENQTKDFYLNKLLNQGEVVVQGYIQHPSKVQTKYAIIPYHGYDFITLATPKIVAKFPLHFIEIKKESIPQALTDIHMDEEELLSTVKDFVRSFRKLYKECASKNELIKEHNTTVHKIYVKIKNGEAKLIKQDIPIAIPKVVKTATTHPINSNKKPFKVIKKRKFTLLKYK